MSHRQGTDAGATRSRTRPRKGVTVIPRSDFDRDLLLALRFCYYVHAFSVVTDQQYDAMEREYRLVNGDLETVGGDRPENYPPRVRALGLYLLLSGRGIEKHRPTPPRGGVLGLPKPKKPQGLELL